MNLNNLKPAWQRLRLLNAMQPIDHTEILSILENAEGMAVRKPHRFLIMTVVVIVFTCCCQGG